MSVTLRLHPDSCCAAATRIEVEITRPDTGSLVLSYVVSGDTAGLRVPPVTAPVRSDGLWEHTCFEAFVRASSGSEYFEFNLAPSTQWAAYRFADYRSGMTPAEEIAAPRIDVHRTDARYTLHAALALDRLIDLPFDAPWQLGLSAVIEEASGNKSHWALAHPPGPADFHHSDCFALELPAA